MIRSKSVSICNRFHATWAVMFIEAKLLGTRPRTRTKPRGRGRGRGQNHEAEDNFLLVWEDIHIISNYTRQSSHACMPHTKNYNLIISANKSEDMPRPDAPGRGRGQNFGLEDSLASRTEHHCRWANSGKITIFKGVPFFDALVRGESPDPAAPKLPGWKLETLAITWWRPGVVIWPGLGSAPDRDTPDRQTDRQTDRQNRHI